jgi:hypothetical protein
LKVIADLKAEYIQRPQLDLFFLLIEASYMYGNMKMTQKIYDTLPKYDLKPDARIQQRYMDHNKITEKKNKLIEEQKKKDDAKARKLLKEKTMVGNMGSSVSNTMSTSALRASNNNPPRIGT